MTMKRLLIAVALFSMGAFGAAAQTQKQSTQDTEEMKMEAIRGLSDSNPAAAVGQIEKVLASDVSFEMKERLVSILSDMGTTESRGLLERIARGQSNPKLQVEAIRHIGDDGDAASLKTLADIYSKSTDNDVKEQILRAFGNADDEEQLLAVAKGEKNIELRGEAVRQLGNMDSASALSQLYLTETSSEIKGEIIHALGNTDSEKELAQIAEHDSSAEMRLQAIHGLGNLDEGTAAPALISLYGKEKDGSVKEEILHALANADAEKELAHIAGNDASAEMRLQAIRGLANMDEGVAAPALISLYGKEKDTSVKEGILHALANADAEKELAQIAENDASAEMRSQAIHGLGNIDGDTSGPALAKLYDKEKDPGVKQEILHALASQDNAKILVAIARKETNPELRKYIIHELSNMDDKDAAAYMMEILNK